MMIQTAWDTTVGKAKQVEAKTIASTIKEEILSSKISLDSGRDTIDPYSCIYQLDSLEKPICVIPYNGERVSAFRHSIVIENVDPRYSSVIAVDVRECVSNVWGKNARVTRPAELAWHKANGILQGAWISEGFNKNILKSLSNYPASLYATAITEAIVRRYFLDFREQTTIQILCAFFYNYCLLKSDISFDTDRQVGELVKITRCDAQMIKDVITLDKVSEMRNLIDLCECIKLHSGSVRLQDFNVAILLTTMGGYWLGFNASNMVGVALEHVPTWLLLCYSALASQTYKRSLLSKVAEKSAKAHNGEGYVIAMARNYLLTTAVEMK